MQIKAGLEVTSREQDQEMSSKEGWQCNQPIVKSRETLPPVSPTKRHDLLNMPGFANSGLPGAGTETCMEAPM